ncbi:MAG: hypothetical protein ACXAB4_03980 [Candidatus Hodarchaeales archaeon]|jgi:hypothetical protein
MMSDYFSLAEDSPIESPRGQKEPLHILLQELISERKQKTGEKREQALHSLKMRIYARTMKIGILQAFLLAGGLATGMLIDYLESEDCPVMLRLNLDEKMATAPASFGMLETTLGGILSIAFILFLLGGLFTNLTLSKFAYQNAKLTLNPRMFTSFLLVFPFIIIVFARLYLLLILELFYTAWLTNRLFDYYWNKTIAQATGQVLLIVFAGIALWCLPIANEIKNSFMQWDTEAFVRFNSVTKLIVVTFSLGFLAVYLGLVTLAGLETGLYFRELLRTS